MDFRARAANFCPALAHGRAALFHVGADLRSARLCFGACAQLGVGASMHAGELE
jgi:hypothetical protein